MEGEDEDGGEGGGPYKKINYGDRHYYHAQDSQKLSVEMERRLRGYHHENNMGRHVDHRIRPYTNTGSYLSKFPEQRGGFSNRQHGVPHPDEGPYSRDSRYQNPHFYVNRRTSAPNSASNHQPKPPYPRIDHSLPNPHDQIPPLPRSDYHQLPPIQVGLKSIPPSSAPVHTDDLSSTKQPYPPDPLLHYSHSERHSPLPKHSSIAHSSKPASASTSAALYSHSPSFKYDSVSTSAPSVRSSQNFSVAIDSEFKQDTSLPQIRVRDNASSSVYRGYKRSSNTPFRPISDLPSYSPVSSSSFDRWNPYNPSLASGTKFVDSAKPKPFDPYISSYQNDPPFDDLAPQYGPPSSTISHSENPIGLSIKLDPAANNSSSRRITVNDLLASDSQANYQSATTQNNDKDRI
ncbi:hypothetical protein AX774_g2348 [Zancudomyces culisetae]|uniref:Uncharacterized protein n=1 Tax=Zancudomyces culisetae TaxID=1213189 RepID=A0A1R1PT42_ZANCU|nr:hypothetical protein AX774_g2348 [Zancudomyces culisetae]|eukprot:OMH84121.1 hypothetical protein AX774_g2348 [Zancudomyces culisetae]